MAERDTRRRRRRSSQRPESRRPRRGGLTSLRTSFRNLVGQGKSSGKKASFAENFIWTLLFVIAIILLVLALAR